ncbi:MAG: hypothetical protein ACXVB9_01400 [Bdellovibrionota bacterium]
MIRAALLISIFSALSAQAAGSGSSVNHYDIDRMSCQSAKLVVAKEGAVIFQHGDDYNRVVKDPSFCASGEEPSMFGLVNWVIRDCYPGYYCNESTGNAQ